MKKLTSVLFVISIIIAVLVIVSAVLIILRGNEDTWICTSNGWVRHGNPSANMPSRLCTKKNQNKSCQLINDQCCKNNVCSEVNITCELGKKAIFTGCSLNCTTQMKCVPAEDQEKACTMEAKICPDGSAVGRSGSNCEFAPCPATSTTQMANPASVNCTQKGGKLEIRTDADGGQIGYCKFNDGSECEEWAFMRGECKIGVASSSVGSIFDLIKAKVGDKVGDMTIISMKKIDKEQPLSTSNAEVKFIGQVAIKGEYQYQKVSDVGGEETIYFFNLTPESELLIPKIGSYHDYFIISNVLDAKKALDITRDSTGTADIIINNYDLVLFPSEIPSSAKFISLHH